MKLLVLTALVGLAAAKPTPTWNHEIVVVGRADDPASKPAVTDQASIGFATLNGGTTGGLGGAVTTASTLAEFTAAVGEKNTAPGIVFVKGVIEGSAKVRIGSNKTIVGLPGSRLKGIGLHFRRQKNLILRNIVSSFVPAANGDALTIDGSTNVWVDHCEFFSVKGSEKDKDVYDGLVDLTHGSDFVTISHTSFHDHWKGSLVGHSDSNADQDRGKLRVTYANNHWRNIGSRGPSLRFGTGHIFNSFFEGPMYSAVNTRMGAQVLVESNVFRNVEQPVTSIDSKQQGYAVVVDTDLGGAPNRAPGGSFSAAAVPYKYTLLGSSRVAAAVPQDVGAILTFEPMAAGNETTTPHAKRAQTTRIW
ncbi:putative pectate lyase [Podospora aff. communis PSN243]|uniref:Pectate lyase n=1 Tax=Podospora aff. communis PSN243 TaxID=3040156 RepID=A0AAV9GIV1_9PEZI|nr:putative pectate lyase [Podospora aff. communis PSN243]